MSSSKIPFIITYKKPGTVPPLFLAGTFSDPEWQPKEMEYEAQEDGEYTFQSEVMVKPGEDYQFKLRIGEGSWWILAENYAVVTDESGNQNSVVTIPKPSSSGEADSLADVNGESVKAGPDEASPPVLITKLNVPDPESSKDVADELKTPLFAHECLGAYDFESEESEEEACPGASPRRDTERKSGDYSPVDVDLNDPTIEKFPSDRTSILDALRTIQTHLGEDQPHLADLPVSPRVVSASRPSIDSTDDMSLSPIPASPNATRRREHRLSHSSFGRSRSAVSLGSIAEDAEEQKPDAEEASEEDTEEDTKEDDTKSQSPPVISLPNPNTASALGEPRSPPSEEDEAVVMKSSEANSADKASKPHGASDKSVPDQSRAEFDNTETNGLSQATNDDSQSKAAWGLAESAPLGSEAVDETDSSNRDLGSVSAPAESAISAVSHKTPRPEAIQYQNPLGTWLRWLVNRALANKLPIILTTGAVALAVGMGWQGSDK